MALDEAQVMEVLKAFGKAFNRADVDGVLACVTDDFEWRLAEGPDAPHGRIVRGAEEVRAAFAERDRTVKSMRFSETAVHVAGDTVIGTFRATGESMDGTPIDKRGVDIYAFRDGRICLKDSYWKRITD